MKMRLRTTALGKVVLTYQPENLAHPVTRTFYSSGGYVFEDLPKGDHIMTPTLEVYSGTSDVLKANQETLLSVIRKAYHSLKLENAKTSKP